MYIMYNFSLRKTTHILHSPIKKYNYELNNFLPGVQIGWKETREPQACRRICRPARSSSGSPSWWCLRGKPHSPPKSPSPHTAWSQFFLLSKFSPKTAKNCQFWPGSWRLPCLNRYSVLENKSRAVKDIWLEGPFLPDCSCVYAYRVCVKMTFSWESINIWLYRYTLLLYQGAHFKILGLIIIYTCTNIYKR